jgi:transcriptional regulator with XRE-family HTH domain
MTVTPKAFGARLRQLRYEQHLARMGDVAAILGMEETTLYAHEGGRATPSFHTMLDLARLYKVPEAALFFFPGTDLRHDLWELIRLARYEDLLSLKPVIEKRVGRGVESLSRGIPTRLERSSHRPPKKARPQRANRRR